MNTIIDLPEIQYLINQFIFIDKDLLPWKLTCRTNYYYKHDIVIQHINFPIGHFIYDRANVIKINTENFVNTNDPEEYQFSSFNYRTLLYINNLKSLYIYSMPRIKNCYLKHITTLEILHLEDSTCITDDSISKLVNLVELVLGYSNFITIKSILKLTKLRTLTISGNYDCHPMYTINPNDVPLNVINLTLRMYNCMPGNCYPLCVSETKIR
jgi:hypothetical protein